MIKKLFILMVLVGFVLSASSQRIPKWKIENVVKSYAADNDTVYVVNFWATFCKPCIEEIPDFLKIVDKYKSQKVKLLLVSLDLPSYYPDKIAAFAKKNDYNTNIVWLNETNADHFCPMIDEKWSGAIPSTIIVNNKTGYRKFVEDQMSPALFEASIKEAIGGGVFNRYLAPMNDAEVIKSEPNSETSDITKNYISFKSSDSAVFSMVKGTVSTIARIENMKIAIIENEGLYYTYSNLGSVKLKKGDVVKKDQLIGYAALDLDGYKPMVDIYLSNNNGIIPLVKENFIARNGKKINDHSFDPIDEPQ